MVKSFIVGKMAAELLDILEILIFENAHFSSNKNLQNLLLITAIKVTHLTLRTCLAFPVYMYMGISDASICMYVLWHIAQAISSIPKYVATYDRIY